MSFAQQMVTALEEALMSNVSIGQIVVDGQTVQFRSRSELLKEYDRWKMRIARESGTRSMIRGTDVS